MALLNELLILLTGTDKPESDSRKLAWSEDLPPVPVICVTFHDPDLETPAGAAAVTPTPDERRARPACANKRRFRVPSPVMSFRPTDVAQPKGPMPPGSETLTTLLREFLPETHETGSDSSETADADSDVQKTVTFDAGSKRWNIVARRTGRDPKN